MDKPQIEEVWRIADIIANATVETEHGSRSLGYYVNVAIDYFGHPSDRYQALLNAAAEAILVGSPAPPRKDIAE